MSEVTQPTKAPKTVKPKERFVSHIKTSMNRAVLAGKVTTEELEALAEHLKKLTAFV